MRGRPWSSGTVASHHQPLRPSGAVASPVRTAAFSAAFDGAPVIQVEGRMFPVEVIHAPLDSLGRDYAEDDENEERHDASAVASARAEALHYIDGVVESVERIVRESTTGDILVFLPSERDIREAGDLLTGRRLRDCELVPLYGRLSNAEQQRVFAPTNRRKVVLATNVAETSLTVPRIGCVVDPGQARVKRYSYRNKVEQLQIEPVSQSSANQRAGRCGRVAAGVCIRLYDEDDFNARGEFTDPEILRTSLASVILRMKSLKIGDQAPSFTLKNYDGKEYSLTRFSKTINLRLSCLCPPNAPSLTGTMNVWSNYFRNSTIKVLRLSV